MALELAHRGHREYLPKAIGVAMAWVAVLVWMGLIFYVSETQAHMSEARAVDGTRVSVPLFGFLPRWTLEWVYHGVAFGILAGLIYFAFRASVHVDLLKVALLAVALSVGYGVFDEWHQSLVPGRTADAHDVARDLLGALSVVGLIHAMATAVRPPRLTPAAPSSLEQPPSHSIGAATTIAIVYNDDGYLHRFKGGLLRTLRSMALNVLAIAPAGPAVSAIERDGVTFVHWPMSRGSKNPIAELRSIVALWRIYRKARPDIVHHFTAKPNVYGAIAARLAGVPIVVDSVNGLGYAFTGRDLKSTLARVLVSSLYRLAFGLSDAVVLQNSDDIADLQERGLLSREKARHVPGGSGVDTSAFDPGSINPAAPDGLRSSLGISPQAAVVLLVGRMLRHKGVAEYVQSARLVRSTREAVFLLVGPTDHGNPASIPSSQLKNWAWGGSVRYLGERQDIPALLALSDLVVLPSYREGCPRVLLEASAMGKPMVACDVPGSRAVVDHGVNGLLVPARDPEALAVAIGQLLDSPERRARMGAAGRDKAVREFDERKVNAHLVRLYDSLLSAKLGPETPGPVPVSEA